ncbi:MAG: hypothetical protein JXD21_03630 [Candidatus Omnitrophica bacterium]|nr:hypothetical protein [Candidatus Omnitrophota bacterium]
MVYKKMFFILMGLWILPVLSGCMLFEHGPSALYVPGAKDAVLTREIDYVSMNLLQSDRAVNIDIYGRPDFYNNKAVFLVNVGKDPFVDFNYEIFVADKDGQKQRRLTFTPDINELRPQWAKTGQVLYVVIPKAGGDPEYYLMNSDGTEPALITEKRFQQLLPAK